MKSIETAPKDGTPVLLFGGDTCEDIASYESFHGIGMENRPVVGMWNECEWVYGYYMSGWRLSYKNPTHWMELP